MSNLLSAERISKSYGEKKLFDDVSLGLNKGDKAALVARNGAGKTTLLNVLAGRDLPDSGTVTYRKDLVLGYLPQEPVFDPDSTALEYLFGGDDPVAAAVREHELALEIGDKARVQAAWETIERLGGWDFEARVKETLFKLDLKRLQLPVKHFSGGQKKRLALARLLIHPPELLLLDEPTNHLDVEMIEWLEEYLSQSNSTFLLVTHDRYFLDNVCRTIYELEDGKLYLYKGNYEYYLEKKTERELRERSERAKNLNLYRRELEWIRRQPKARGTKAKAREDAFEQLKQAAFARKVETTFELKVKMNRIGGKILEIKNVSKSFGDKRILKNFTYTFKPKDRVGIVGRNGVGKTTFVNMLTGVENPDAGTIVVGDTVVFGYYRQDGLEFREDWKVIDAVKQIAEVLPLSDGTKLNASQFLTHFGFPPAQQQTPISRLSGGEKRRLHLLTVLVRNPNFLILDEPTNDLDLITLNALEEFLEHYEGCLVVVSHDRYFTEKTVDHLFILDGTGTVVDYNGRYSQWREERRAAEKDQSVKTSKTLVVRESVSSGRKLTYKERRELEGLEAEIAALELKRKSLEEAMPAVEEHLRLVALSNELAQIQRLIDEKTERWLTLAELAEST
ncbi:MAG: ABC-F family ATP-binding cassette domain-containing protein [Bacteroidia bacterium]|nr:ABC-F family ATP-binding cassette domain-containing protein [Bacteroidia bacterium]MDW8333397.1 ABC-F family ATP-binding cassette domain-containing protein [Bacteroidia bacterium]